MHLKISFSCEIIKGSDKILLKNRCPHEDVIFYTYHKSWWRRSHKAYFGRARKLYESIIFNPAKANLHTVQCLPESPARGSLIINLYLNAATAFERKKKNPGRVYNIIQLGKTNNSPGGAWKLFKRWWAFNSEKLDEKRFKSWLSYEHILESEFLTNN